MIRPEKSEAAEFYWIYIDKVPAGDAVAVLESQMTEATKLLAGISEENSLYRYAPEKWSIRESLNHVTDNERSFVFRALWFARGFEEPLPGFDQDIAAVGAKADEVPLAAHLEEFLQVRMATLSFFRNLPNKAWTCTGIACGYKFTVRALAFIVAGHAAHHFEILRDRYLHIGSRNKES